MRYQGKHWFAQLGYFASIYDTKAAGFQFDEPVHAVRRRAATPGQMALEPDNLYNEIAVSVGWFGLPWNTAVTAVGRDGAGHAGHGFRPLHDQSEHRASTRCRSTNLDGDVSVTRADLTVSARGRWTGCACAASAAYDERDNDSRQGTFTSIVHTDLFPIVRRPRESRLRLRAHAPERHGRLRRV